MLNKCDNENNYMFVLYHSHTVHLGLLSLMLMLFVTVTPEHNIYMETENSERKHEQEVKQSSTVD